ncbi:MAG: hypothetical protein WED59_04650 [Candidatus Woykebacteria bacterium]
MKLSTPLPDKPKTKSQKSSWKQQDIPKWLQILSDNLNNNVLEEERRLQSKQDLNKG